MPIWLMIASVAVLSAALTLAADRMLFARPEASASPSPLPSAAPTARPRIVVQIETPAPQAAPLPISSDERDHALWNLQQDSAIHWSSMLILKAERQVSLAMEALLANNIAQADRELVAANASLEDALRHAPDTLHPQIANERRVIGRVRADLVINPRDLDEELRRMRDRLLALVSSRTQE